MQLTKFKIEDILDVPGCWAEKYFDCDTGLWEVSGNSYFVTEDRKIVYAKNGAVLDPADVAGISNDDSCWILTYRMREQY